MHASLKGTLSYKLTYIWYYFFQGHCRKTNESWYSDHLVSSETQHKVRMPKFMSPYIETWSVSNIKTKQKIFFKMMSCKFYYFFLETQFMYYRLSIYRGHIPQHNAHSPTVTMVELLSDFTITNDTTYLALTGELWGVFHEFFKEK